MTNKLILIIFILLLNGFASLITIDDNIVYDPILDSYWQRDLTKFTSQTLTSQINQIENLSQYQNRNWVMASQQQLNLLWHNYSDFLNFFTPTWSSGSHDVFEGRLSTPVSSMNALEVFTDLNWDEVTRGTYTGSFAVDNQGIFPVSSTEHFFIYDQNSHPEIGAWVVTAGPIPEPSTLFMMIIGLIIIFITFGIRNKFNRLIDSNFMRLKKQTEIQHNRTSAS